MLCSSDDMLSTNHAVKLHFLSNFDFLKELWLRIEMQNVMFVTGLFSVHNTAIERMNRFIKLNKGYISCYNNAILKSVQKSISKFEMSLY